MPWCWGTVNHFELFRQIDLTEILFVVGKPSVPCLVFIHNNRMHVFSTEWVSFLQIVGSDKKTNFSDSLCPRSPYFYLEITKDHSLTQQQQSLIFVGSPHAYTALHTLKINVVILTRK